MLRLADAGGAGYFHMTDTNITIGFFVPNGDFAVVTALFDQLMKIIRTYNFQQMLSNHSHPSTIILCKENLQLIFLLAML